MTKIQIQIAMAQVHASACLRSALDHQARDKGGFSEEQNKAWLDYDEANALLSKLIAKTSVYDAPTEHDSPARLEQVNELPSDES
jgi:hypothetical protein